MSKAVRWPSLSFSLSLSLPLYCCCCCYSKLELGERICRWSNSWTSRTLLSSTFNPFLFVCFTHCIWPTPLELLLYFCACPMGAQAFFNCFNHPCEHQWHQPFAWNSIRTRERKRERRNREREREREADQSSELSTDRICFHPLTRLYLNRQFNPSHHLTVRVTPIELNFDSHSLCD